MQKPVRLPALVALLLLAGTAPARAQGDTRTSTTAAPTGTSSVAPSSEAAEAPAKVRPEDARGRIDEGIEVVDALLFVPRVVLAVPRLALYILYLPLRGLLWLQDELLVYENVIDFLYNDERTAGVVPLAYYAPGLGATFGARAFHNDVFGHGESISISARFAGRFNQAYELALADEPIGETPWVVRAKARYEDSPSLLFAGIGEQGVDSRFSEQRVLGLGRFGALYGPFELTTFGIFNHRVFGPSRRLVSGDQSIETVYPTAMLEGFDEGANTLEVGLEAVLDLRDVRGFTSRGVFARLFGGYVPRLDQYSYGHWGAEVRAFVDLYRGTRVLMFRVAMEAVEGGPDDIPFSSLPRLGGANRLRGYTLDTFRDEKAALGTIEYRYPIHDNVQGHLFVDAGRVANDYDALFGDGPTDFQFGYGGGLLIGTDDATAFRLDIAYGDGLTFFFSTDSVDAFDEWTERL